jgi:hypothetical protein
MCHSKVSPGTGFYWETWIDPVANDPRQQAARFLAIFSRRAGRGRDRPSRQASEYEQHIDTRGMLFENVQGSLGMLNFHYVNACLAKRLSNDQPFAVGGGPII